MTSQLTKAEAVALEELDWQLMIPVTVGAMERLCGVPRTVVRQFIRETPHIRRSRDYVITKEAFDAFIKRYPPERLPIVRLANRPRARTR